MTACDIIAFTKKWEYKGIVDPSIRDSVSWIDVDPAIKFIEANKPPEENWLISIIGISKNK